MATGPGGGSRQIGGAHVTLSINDRQYYQQLLQAQRGLAQWASNAGSVLNNFNFSPLVNGLRNATNRWYLLDQAITRVANSIRAATRAAVAFNAAIQGQASSAVAKIIRAQAAAQAMAVRATAAALAAQQRAQAAAQAATTRASGSAAAQLLRAQQATAIAAVNAVGRVATAVVTAPWRAAQGIVTSGIRLLQSLLGRILSIGPSLGRIGGLGALTVGVAGGFSLLYIHRQIVDMERELTRLRRTTGATAAEIQQLSRSFNDMGTTLAGVDLNKILELAIMGARLGVPREQLNLFTRDLSKVAAVLEDIPIDEATTRFSGLISVFELQYTDTIKLASALNALDIASNAAAGDILNIAGRMSGAASTIGMTAQQTLALATAMRQARVPIETAGTAMGQILGRMTGRDLPEFARLAGMSARAFQQLLGQDALAALVKVEQGLGRLGAIERFRALDQLHLDGQRVRLVMLQLVPVLDELGKYLGIANEEWRTTNSIMAGFRLQAETASAMFTRMWNNIQLVAVALGHALLPVMKGVSNAISNMAYDITDFLNQRGDRMRAWGERMARVFETLGAVTRVNWGDVGAVLMATFNDLWGQIKDRVSALWDQAKQNLFWYWGNFLKLALNAFNNIRAMAVGAIAAVLPLIQSMITNAIMAVVRSVAAALPAALRAMVNFKALANVPQAILKPPQMVPWLQGIKPPPGFGVPGIQMPGVLGMIPGMFGLGADQQRKDLVRRQALGALQDMVARFLGGRGGRGNADPGMGRLAALAAMQDAGEDAGGLPGGGGGGGGFGGFGQAMAGGGMGGVRRPLGPDPIGANRMALGMVGLGFGGMVNNPHLRRIELDAWRAKMGMRRPGRVNLMEMMGAQNPLLMGRRQFNQDRMARMALQRQHRMDLLRRNENRLLGRDPRRLDWRQRQIDMMQRRMGLPRAWLGALPDAAMRAAEQANRAAGVREWGETTAGRIIGLLEKIEQRIGIPLLD
jgi:TP901 family phage tail tape measure protein